LHGLLRRSVIRSRENLALRRHHAKRLSPPADKRDALLSQLESNACTYCLNSPSWRNVAIILVALTIIRVFAGAHAGLAPDETYYWLWAQTPAFGYADHPPMVAWWIWLSTRIFGDTALGIRVPSILAALATSLVVFCTARELFSAESIGLRAVLWFNAMILIGVGAIFSIPDASSTLFWSISLWGIVAIWRRGCASLWLLVGLVAGLGCVSKYTNLFLGLGILVWLLDPSGRRWLFSPWLWAGGLIAVVVFLPVFLWNAQHDWISFYRQFGRLAAHEITFRYLGEFVLSQVGLLNPLIAFFAALAGVAVWTKRAEPHRGPYILLLSTMAPLFIYMIIHAVHDRVQGNWLAPIYPQIAILAAAYVDHQMMPRFRLRLAQSVVPVGVGLSTIIVLYLAHPVKLPLLIPNPADRLEGWQDFATAVGTVSKQNGASWIATANYDVNAELAFYQREAEPVREIIERERYNFAPLDTVKHQKIILVLSEEEMKFHFNQCFSVIKPVATVARRRPNGGLIARYTIERASGGLFSDEGCRAERNSP
jgi:4-amino-4-deoxy-L-arabinose transferase-like glycosyltransferase